MPNVRNAGGELHAYDSLAPGNHNRTYGLLAVGKEIVDEIREMVCVAVQGVYKAYDIDNAVVDRGIDGCEPDCQGHRVESLEYALTPELVKQHGEIIIPQVSVRYEGTDNIQIVNGVRRVPASGMPNVLDLLEKLCTGEISVREGIELGRSLIRRFVHSP